MRLFLDIDGVILGKDDAQSSIVRLARRAEALLRLAIDRFDPWWLTTHSDGTIAPIVRHLAPYCPPNVLDLVQRIRPGRFKTLKTEVFADIGSDFLWSTTLRWRSSGNGLPIVVSRTTGSRCRTTVYCRPRSTG